MVKWSNDQMIKLEIEQVHCIAKAISNHNTFLSILYSISISISISISLVECILGIK